MSGWWEEEGEEEEEEDEEKKRKKRMVGDSKSLEMACRVTADWGVGGWWWEVRDMTRRRRGEYMSVSGQE